MAKIAKEEIVEEITEETEKVEEVTEDDNELTGEMLEEFTNGRGEVND